MIDAGFFRFQSNPLEMLHIFAPSYKNIENTPFHSFIRNSKDSSPLPLGLHFGDLEKQF